MKNCKENEKKVIELIEDLCMITIEDNTKTLTDDLALDSLRMVMLLILLEEEFGIELDESDMNPFVLNTVQDVIDLISKYVVEEESLENA